MSDVPEDDLASVFVSGEALNQITLSESAYENVYMYYPARSAYRDELAGLGFLNLTALVQRPCLCLFHCR